MPTFRKLTKRVVIICNVVVAIIFLFACANAFLYPEKWWFVSLLGLAFPFLLLLVFGFFIFWLFLSARRWSLISLVAMIIGWQNIHALVALNFSAGFKTEKPAGSLRVISWNLRSWDEFTTAKPGASGHRQKMMQFIKQQNADLMCFQEFYESHQSKDQPGIISYIQQQLHYPYYYFSRDYQQPDGLYEAGVAIFSRYPIINTFQQKFKKSSNQHTAESLIAADIDVNGKTIRVFTTHLQSVLFQHRDFRSIQIIENAEDSMLQASKSIVKKLKRAYGFRCSQADMVREISDTSSYPVIICGDFNDVPNSYTYFRILGNKQDAFIKKGFGIGRTYVNLSPTLRIDYIFAAPELNVLQCKRFTPPYSDHHPVVADFALQDSTK